ncbi:MAG: Gfo/Idh/MocA family protein [Planctomycetota bacterium]|jgi:predicted dehydrogenase
MAKALKRKLNMGMVGGGPDSFIGDVHLKAAQLDGLAEIKAGAFSQTPAKSKQRGKELFLNNSRVYGSYKEMISKELKLPEDERIDFVSIVTPNNSHFKIAKDFLNAGFSVILDKPMTLTLKEAKELQKIVKKKKKQIFALTHNYTGYPMVKLARDVIKKKLIGNILKVVVQYPQGWLIERIEKQGAKQAEWRTDPRRSGKAGCMGDIGTHAENLAEYITGLKITELIADLGSVVKGRKLDDDGNCLLKFNSGARGILYASQVSVGELNGLQIKIHGDKGTLKWKQEDPNELYMYNKDGSITTYRRGTDAIGGISKAAEAATRLPFGHPEGFYEAFANIYKNACNTITAIKAGKKPSAIDLDFPTVDDGLRGMQFIETVVKSSSQKKWIKWIK